MSAQAYCLCPRGSNSVRGLSQGPKADEVVVTVQSDGVVCYSSARRELVRSWTLGSQQLKFVTKAVYVPSSNSYYAVVQQSNSSSSGIQSLLSWPVTTSSSSLEQLAHRHVLSGSVHSIHPVPARSKQSVDPSDMDAITRGVAVVYTDGRVALGVDASVQVADRPTGMRLLSSHTDADKLAVICRVKGESRYQLSLYTLHGLKHISNCVFQPPSDSAKLVSASFQDGHLAILWSDGLLQAYNTAPTPGNPLTVHTTARLRSFNLASSAMTLDNQEQHPQAPLQQQQQHSGKKRRKSAAVAAAAAREPLSDSATASTTTAPMLVPLGEHAVAAVREPSDLSTNGHQSTELEITVANTQYGCVQSVTTVKLPGGGGVESAAPGLQEAVQLRSGMGSLVLLMHSAVWYISIQAQPATLASLVGALNLCSPTHPAAQASLRALGEEECSSISTPPQVEHARPVWTQSLLESGEASSSGDNHLGSFATPATLRWQLDASTQQVQMLEAQLAQHLTHGWTDQEACRSFMAGTLKFCRDNKLSLSTRVVATTAAYLAQQQWWGILDDLLRAQALSFLALCPGLSLAMVQGGQFTLLASILPKSLNLPEQELLSILQLLLPPVTPPLAASCKQHSSRLRALAASAVGAAEEACMAHIRAKGELSPTDAALHVKVAKAAYAAAAVDGLTPQEVCMHGIASMTHEPGVLLSVLRQLSGAQAMALARYLLKLMTKYSGNLNDTLPEWVESSNMVPFRVPTLQHVLQWLALLFDAHITSFHKQAGSVEILRHLRQLVGRHVSMVQQMSQLRGIMEHLTSKAPVPFADHQADSLYSVELLDFRIL
ncbi:hypothetical protein ABBQ32_008522 [Trebouxia sp. C0010 RCD-2024]